MPSFIRFVFVSVLLFSSAFCPAIQADTTQKPVTESELMALVAGNALSENTMHEVETRGLAFRPNQIYKTQLKNAGADAPLLAALDKAKVKSTAQDGPTELDLIAHLSNAGQMLRIKQFEPATNELTAVLQDGGDAEAGFVMGEVLRREEQFDLAVSVYEKVLQQHPDFPEAHTKLAFILYRTNDDEGATREAGLALARTPANAEAHKNMALPLVDEKKFAAALQEFQAALRIKPDYAVGHADLGLLFDQKHDSAGAIAEYKKAIALDPSEFDWHYRLGILLNDTGDREGAVREYREVKRLDPTQLGARHNLGVALTELDPDAAIREFHELLAIAPNFQLAHIGLGVALNRKGDVKGSEAEYRKAVELDPSDAEAHSQLAGSLMAQNKNDQALAEYEKTIALDPAWVTAYKGIGSIYLERKDYAHAIQAYRIAEKLKPDDWDTHGGLGEALGASGDLKSGIAELRQARALFPKNIPTLADLAGLLDKDGDLAGALQVYREMADLQRTDEARAQYAAAQQRVNDKIKALRAAGQQAEAADLEAKADEKASGLESQWLDSLEECHKAIADRRYQEAEKTCQATLTIAEKLRPVDQHLLQSIMDLANIYRSEGKYAEAQVQWQRGLSVAEQHFGPESQQAIFGFEGLAGVEYLQKDYASAASNFARAAELDEKLFDASDRRVLTDLFWLGASYENERAFDKAEPILLRVLKANDNGDTRGNPLLEGSLLQLGRLYLAWGKYEQAEPYCRKSLAMREQWYGPNSAVLAEPLQTLSDVLMQLGKKDEAAELKRRREAVLASKDQASAKP